MPHRAIDYEMQDEIVTEDVGAIAVVPAAALSIWTSFPNTGQVVTRMSLPAFNMKGF